MRSVIKGILVTLFATFMMSTTLTSCHTQKKIVNQGQIVQQDDKHKPGKPNLRLNKEQRKLLDEAETWLGTPYLYGGQEKGKGADCSGFVMMVYLNALNVKLPRVSTIQADFCKPVKETEIVVGDLVFFATGKDSAKVTHVGIMIDNDGTFIHASSSKGVVHSSMKNNWYRKRLFGYGRVPR